MSKPSITNTQAKPGMPSDEQMKALRNGQGWNGLSAGECAKALSSDVYAAMSAIHEKSEQEGRPYHASENRMYNALEATLNELEDIANKHTVNRSGVVTPVDTHGDYHEGQPLAADQSFVGAMRALNRIPTAQAEAGDLSFGKYLRGALTGRWDGAENELGVHNALSGASTSAGGILIPEILSGELIDLARAQTRVIQAGARVVPMANRKVTVPKWAADPVPEWRGENDAFAEDDAALTSIELNAHGLGVVTKVSIELIEDTNIDAELKAAFAKSFAQVLDLAALYADGTGDAPTGVKSTAGVNVQAAATNGASPTWATLVDAVGRVRDRNEYPNAQIMSDRTARSLAMLVGGDGQYVAPPTYLDGVRQLTTGQVPNNLAVGTSGTTTSDVFTADWTKFLIGVRSELRIFTLTERYLPDAGQIGFVCHWRGDFAVTRTEAFDVVTGVKA
jgi:HK97 family phage major capsid protein